MEKITPIRLPYDLEKEAEESHLRTIQERIATDRKNNTLVSSVIVFLQKFEVKIIEFNLYTQMFIPYPTISQTIKDIIRNKLRTLNEFYFSYTGSNPHPIISECLKKDNTDVIELQVLYKRLGDLLNKLNNNTLCISNKQIIFAAQRKSKDEYNWNEYEWT